jgi:hypothetical protein
MPLQVQPVPLHNNALHFNRKNFNREYAVQVVIEIDYKDIQVITYNVLVAYSVNSNWQPLVEVISTNFLVNHKEPDDVMEEIAIKCRETLSRCVFRVTTGNEVTGLENYVEILEKWKVVKQQILEQNTGEVVDKYLQTFENVLNNKDLLLARLRIDTFISHYFFPVYDEAFHGLRKKNREVFTYFNFEYDDDVILEITNDGAFDEYGDVVLLKKLAENDNRMFPVEKYETEYTLDATMAIAAIHGEFSNHGKKYFYTIEQI